MRGVSNKHCLLTFHYVCCIYSSALKASFYHGSKHNEQWEQSDLGPYCLQYRLPKNISRGEEQTTFNPSLVLIHPRKTRPDIN